MSQQSCYLSLYPLIALSLPHCQISLSANGCIPSKHTNTLTTHRDRWKGEKQTLPAQISPRTIPKLYTGITCRANTVTITSNKHTASKALSLWQNITHLTVVFKCVTTIYTIKINKEWFEDSSLEFPDSISLYSSTVSKYNFRNWKIVNIFSTYKILLSIIRRFESFLLLNANLGKNLNVGLLI